MRTKRNKQAGADTTQPLTSDSTGQLNSNSADDGNKPNRISFNITGEGVPDFSAMSPKTKERLLTVLNDKTVQKELGFSPEQVKEISEIGFGDDEVNMLLDLIGGIDSVAASKIFGVPMEITMEAFKFTTDHRKKLSPPMVRLMNKWGPSIIKTWKDEIGVAVLLASCLNTQVQLMHILEAKRKKNTQPSKTPTPIAPPKEQVAKEQEKGDSIGANA